MANLTIVEKASAVSVVILDLIKTDTHIIVGILLIWFCLWLYRWYKGR